MDTTRVAGDTSIEIAAYSGAARDVVTTEGSFHVGGEASLGLTLSRDGSITKVEADPDSLSCRTLIGKRPGFGFRASVKHLLVELSGTPLGLLVDDLSGAHAPAGYGMIREQMLSGQPVTLLTKGRGAVRADACAGWRTDGKLYRSITSGSDLPFEALPPVSPDLGSGSAGDWHAMPDLGPRQSRRVRRLDVWRDDDRVLVDSMFRDSAIDPDGTVRVVHEYTVMAELDAATLTVLSIRAEPRSLPFSNDCPMAERSAQLFVGRPVQSLRQTVGGLSKGTISCTHLNDALRFLSDSATLVGYLTD